MKLHLIPRGSNAPACPACRRPELRFERERGAGDLYACGACGVEYVHTLEPERRDRRDRRRCGLRKVGALLPLVLGACGGAPVARREDDDEMSCARETAPPWRGVIA